MNGVSLARSPSCPATAAFGLVAVLLAAPAFAQSAGPHAVRLEPDVIVPMPDGTRLAADLYLPAGVEGPLPVVYIGTMYGKDGWRDEGSDARFFASHGYAVAVQDARGRFASEGGWETYRHTAADASATVSWLAAQPWSNGRVGTYGCSYLGDAQIFLATQRNPAHAAMIAQAPGGLYRFAGPYNDGVIEVGMGFGWLRTDNYTLRLVPPGDVAPETALRYRHLFDGRPRLPDVDHAEMWRTLPVADMMRRSGSGPNVWDEWMRHDPGDPWFDPLHIDGSERFDVPGLHVNSWYDYGAGTTIEQLRLMVENAESARGRDHQWLVMAPSTHCAFHGATGNTVVGQRPVGDARFDWRGLYLDWFGHWLKDEATGMLQRPRFTYYLMGRGEWREADAFPVPGTRMMPYYLRGGGNANSRFGDGILSTSPPGDEPTDRYTYDPATPVPSVGGPLCCTGSDDAPAGAYDQRQVEARHDVLVYSTPPLEAGIEVTGLIELVLYVSSSAPDTDFTAKLVDVYPDGTAYNVQEGIARARYRQGLRREVFMEPGGVYAVRINLNATGNWFGPGHRIRVEVSSSSFPRWERNLNTGGVNRFETEWRLAENVVHHSAEHPSRLVLPVVPPGATRRLEGANR